MDNKYAQYTAAVRGLVACGRLITGGFRAYLKSLPSAPDRPEEVAALFDAYMHGVTHLWLSMDEISRSERGAAGVSGEIERWLDMRSPASMPAKEGV